MTKELALSFPQRNGFFYGLIGTEMHEVEIDGKKYNFQSNGTLKSGWTHENDMIQYYNKYGYRLKGWQTIKGKKTFFSKNGNAYTDRKKMVTNSIRRV